MDYKLIKRETEKALKTPRAGMRFHEMFSAWAYILNVDESGNSMVRTFSGHPSNPIAESVSFYRYHSLQELRDSLKYYSYCDDNAFERMKTEFWVSQTELRSNNADFDDISPKHWEVTEFKDETNQ